MNLVNGTGDDNTSRYFQKPANQNTFQIFPKICQIEHFPDISKNQPIRTLSRDLQKPAKSEHFPEIFENQPIRTLSRDLQKPANQNTFQRSSKTSQSEHFPCRDLRTLANQNTFQRSSKTSQSEHCINKYSVLIVGFRSTSMKIIHKCFMTVRLGYPSRLCGR